MKPIHFLLTLLCLAASPVAANAQPVEIGVGLIDAYFRYSDAEPFVDARDDLVVRLATPVDANVCRGGWISKDDGQYADLEKVLLAARITRSQVRLVGDPTRLFPGSSDKYCYLTIVVL
jgi:hypothetical protein